MRALLCDNPHSLKIVEREAPRPGPGQALVRVRRAGVCGTDYHIVGGRQPFFEYPRIIGHELSGTVEEAPAGSGLRKGQTVTIIPYLHCGHCIACRQGKTNCCTTLSVLGVHRDGGMADWQALPVENLIAVDDLSLDEAAMVEFLAIGAHGIRRSGLRSDQRVLVVGAGPIGLSAIVFAKARGAHVTVVDGNAKRLAFAVNEARADTGIEASPDIKDRLKAVTGGDFFDLVIDATGSPAAMDAGFAYVASGGSYVLLSIVRSAITFDDPEFHRRELTVFASRNATREDFDTVLAAMRAGKVPSKALATHRGSLDDAPSLIPEWAKPETGVVKALLEI
jgi:2-desacetyl-2-hydroxyethyl bacteriochlorophyllide A dehydrogenase